MNLTLAQCLSRNCFREMQHLVSYLEEHWAHSKYTWVTHKNIIYFGIGHYSCKAVISILKTLKLPTLLVLLIAI